MITAGVDCGAKNIKVVIFKDGKVVGKIKAPAGIDMSSVAEKAYDDALKEAGLSRSSVEKVVTTGAGKNEPKFQNDNATEVGADGRGIHFLYPNVRTLIDVGAEEGRAIKIDENGKIVDFAVNEKCAAGAGAFTEAMARALEVPLEEFGAFSLKGTQEIAMNAQCAVFAESEVVSLVHRKIPRVDIARSIHNAIADRITSMVRRVGITPDIALIGGVANNIGFVASLKKDLEMEIIIPEDCEYVGAIGAAIIATEK
jgi:benzoyl-CoA reductase subunit D